MDGIRAKIHGIDDIVLRIVDNSFADVREIHVA